MVLLKPFRDIFGPFSININSKFYSRQIDVSFVWKEQIIKEASRYNNKKKRMEKIIIVDFK